MKGIFSRSIRVFILGLLISLFSLNANSAEADLDTSQYNSTLLEKHKAITFAALHYQWVITEHNRNNFKLKYKKADLNVAIGKQNIKITQDNNKDINPKWILRLEKLIERRLNYYSKIRTAKELADFNR